MNLKPGGGDGCTVMREIAVKVFMASICLFVSIGGVVVFIGTRIGRLFHKTLAS
jgi:hypothetical protein